MRRATALILAALARGHAYGFEIMDVTGLPSGSVYPALRRLERGGWVQSRWETTEEPRGPGRPTRRVYRLTSEGQSQVQEARDRLGELLGPAKDLLTTEPGA